MCTVTVIPLENNNFILSSNRDEAPKRSSLAPQFYEHKEVSLLFPKDEQSEGSWIGLSENKRLICLLNGGFEIHERKTSYRQSRGIVVKDLLACDNLVHAIDTYNFEEIEPFTMVVVEWARGLSFYELIWDGSKRHFSQLPLEPKMWSSSTLYNKEMRAERQQWFNDFKKENLLNPYSMFVFHQTAGKGNLDYGVIMDRGFVKTTSITRVEKVGGDVAMRYYDISKNTHDIRLLSESKQVHG